MVSGPGSAATGDAERRVVIIGGGPAGLMAAEVVAKAGHRVTVYERMPTVGRKLLLAGRGGLNLTHSEPLGPFLTRYGASCDRLGTLITAFPPQATIAWAEGLGQPTFTGSSGRVFPKALKASPLLRAWLRRLGELGVTVRTRSRWRGFDDGGGFVIEGPDGTLERIGFDAVILALGGASWPRLGSDGAWVATLREAGVAVQPLSAANAGVAIAWSDVFVGRFAGTPLKRIAITLDGLSQRGEVVITRDGLEGGAIYGLGPRIRDCLGRGQTPTIAIDLRPDESIEALGLRLSRPRAKQSMANFLRKAAHLPPAAIGLLREAGMAKSVEEPHALATLIKAVALTVTGLGPIERAISSAGGVDFKGVTPELMLQALPGVFVAGEMLDWEAPTGGYLLQGVLASGVAAAQGALRWLAEESALEPVRAG